MLTAEQQKIFDGIKARRDERRRLAEKQRREDALESVREFYRRLDGTGIRVFSDENKPVKSNSDEAEFRLYQRHALINGVYHLVEERLIAVRTDEEENWITINGAHVKVEEGQSKEEAIKGFIEKKEADRESEETASESEEQESGSAQLTDSEKSAVTKYISPDSYKINEKLRNGEPLTSEDQEWANNLDSALDKMPKFEGEVFRSIDKKYPDEFVRKNYEVGKETTFSAYTSSNADEVYDSGMSIQYVIKSKTGRDIREYNEEEGEVLFKRGTKFRTTKIESYTSKTVKGYTIHMEEV